MRPIRGIVFDKDGTLFDFATTWEAWAASFLKRLTGNPVEAQRVGAAIGFDYATRKFAPQSIVIAGTPGEVARALLPFCQGMSEPQVLALLNEEAENAPQAQAVPLIPFLTALKADGLALGVATNDAESPALAHLNSAGVTDLFDFIAGFDSGHGAKPGPGQLLAFAKATGLDPQHILMVGDSTHDLLAGQAAGMRCVGVLTGLAGIETLAPHAEVVLENIGHLPDWIENVTNRHRGSGQ
jgi:phosphoglycolate phosphatase